MDPVSIDVNPSGSNHLRASSRLPSHPLTGPQTQSIESHALTDVGKLAERVDASSDSIRSEEVERGKALVADPNWPSDSLLDDLAGKLIATEDFEV